MNQLLVVFLNVNTFHVYRYENMPIFPCEINLLKNDLFRNHYLNDSILLIMNTLGCAMKTTYILGQLILQRIKYEMELS